MMPHLTILLNTVCRNLVGQAGCLVKHEYYALCLREPLLNIGLNKVAFVWCIMSI